MALRWMCGSSTQGASTLDVWSQHWTGGGWARGASPDLSRFEGHGAEVPGGRHRWGQTWRRVRCGGRWLAGWYGAGDWACAAATGALENEALGGVPP